jgi:hypothetical protein
MFSDTSKGGLAIVHPFKALQTHDKPNSSATEGTTRMFRGYLVFAIIANSAIVLLYLLGREAVKRSTPTLPDWAFPVLIVTGLFNLVCAIRLLRWKKWGFWGLVASVAIILCVNLAAGLGFSSAVIGLLGVLMLYGVLHIGKANKGWPQLD